MSADFATYIVAKRLYELRVTESLEVVTNRILAAEGTSGGGVYFSDSQSIVLTDPYIAMYSTSGVLLFERIPILPDNQVPPKIPGPNDFINGTNIFETPGESNGIVAQVRKLTPSEQFSLKVNGNRSKVGSLVVGLTSARASETFRNLVRVQVLFAIVILGIAILGIAILLKVGLRPLVRVARTAEEISGGDLSRRIPIHNSSTEIGAVSLALNDAFDKVEQSEDRMRGFVADASHELRTPLATIRGWADLYLNNGIKEWHDVDIAMTRIRSESDRLTDLVEQLLTLARSDVQSNRDLQHVELGGLVLDVGNFFSEQLEGHVIAYEISETLRNLAGFKSDPLLVRQILINLISNAIRHTPPGTSIHVAADVEADFDHVLITVCDSGQGMRPEQLALAYDRFWRAESGRGPNGGTGLGLAIVRNSVHALGGTIVLKSEQGSGLSATVRLPTYYQIE